MHNKDVKIKTSNKHLPIKTKSNKINIPVNKSISHVLQKKYKKRLEYMINNNSKINKKSKYPAGISVITSTNRQDYMNNVFENFSRQDYNDKELIIVLNNNEMNLNKWKQKANQYTNIKVYQLDEEITLGKCLNFGIENSKYDIIAKFDDDDYYGKKYLSDSILAFNFTNAGVVGKATSYVYFERSKILAIRRPYRENRYVKHMDGPSMLIKREVFDKIKFADIPRGVDTQYSKDCCKKQIKIFSTNKFHHVYVRHDSPQQHTWKIPNNKLLSFCRIVKENITDFRKYIDR